MYKISGVHDFRRTRFQAYNAHVCAVVRSNTRDSHPHAVQCTATPCSRVLSRDNHTTLPHHGLPRVESTSRSASLRELDPTPLHTGSTSVRTRLCGLWRVGKRPWRPPTCTRAARGPWSTMEQNGSKPKNVTACRTRFSPNYAENRNHHRYTMMG